MKTQKNLILTLVAFLALQTLTMANGRIHFVKKDFDLSGFTGIEAGGTVRVLFTQAEQYSVSFEADEKLLDLVKMSVSDGVLKISGNTGSPTKLQAVIACPELNLVKLSGAATFNTDGVIQAEALELWAGGASKIEAAVEISGQLTSHLSGASKIILYGNATSHETFLSGASKLIAQGLETSYTFVDASGASEARVAAEKLEHQTSGNARITNIEGDTETKISSVAPRPSTTDSVSINLGKVKIKVLDGDSTVVVIGSHKMVVDEKGNVDVSKAKKEKKRKFNGHWGGVDLGVNGMLTPDFTMDYGRGYEFLDQRMEKSINVNVNFFEQNIPLNRRRTIGLVSGLGLSWNNYRFANNVMLQNENNRLTGYYMDGVSVKKSKLVNTFLTLPLFIEFQGGTSSRKNNLHLALGVIGGWRFSSHTKVYFLEANKMFWLRETIGNSAVVTMVSPSVKDRNIVKNFDGFQQSPFKLDASVRAGWGVVDLYATYSLTPMFIKNRGPELYPYSIGISISVD